MLFQDSLKTPFLKITHQRAKIKTQVVLMVIFLDSGFSAGGIRSC